MGCWHQWHHGDEKCDRTETQIKPVNLSTNISDGEFVANLLESLGEWNWNFFYKLVKQLGKETMLEYYKKMKENWNENCDRTPGGLMLYMLKRDEFLPK